MARPDTVWLEYEQCRVVMTRDKAIWVEFTLLPSTNVDYPNGKRREWMPKSQLGPGNELAAEGDFGALECSEWIAEQKGLPAPEEIGPKGTANPDDADIPF
jgi:hypothetical protein